MGENKRRLLIGVVLLLIVCIGLIQMWADPPYLKMMKERNSSSAKNELMVQLPGQFVVASFAGFKEVIAGALWVRADSFFHTGNFTAIIPIVRLTTWLDPHNIDVFTTGAWHLDYNFVDEKNQMSDKRYIPSSIALLKEGIRNNPRIYDLYFELAWTHYNKKLEDYDKAAYYIEQACKRPAMDPNTGLKRERPQFVDRMLAHMYEKTGKLDKAIDAWERARRRALETMKKNPLEADRGDVVICERNLAILYMRMGWRYGDMAKYKKGVEMTQSLCNGRFPPIDKWAVDGAAKDYAQRVASNNPPKDAMKPLDAGFEATFKKVAPKSFIIQGNLNLVQSSEYKGLASEVFTHWYQQNETADANTKVLWRDGCRVSWRLQDLGYKLPERDTFDWKIDTSKTVIWDSIHVSGGHFSSKTDLSDPRFAEMFPFKASKYKLTIWVTPQDPGVPDFVQDRIGWRGEALTDKKYLDTETHPGLRMLKKEIILDRKDIL